MKYQASVFPASDLSVAAKRVLARSAHAVLFAFDDCDTMIGTIGCDAPIGCVALVGCDVCPTFSAALTP